MSNTNTPNGFQEFGRLDGSAPTYGRITRKVASGDTNAIGFGDPVTSLGTGYVTLSTAGTTQISGIFYGCKYVSSATGQEVWSPNWPGSGAANDPEAYISSDPNTLFVAQSNSTAITFADIDANINFVIGTPATTAAGGFSTSSLNQSTIATTNTLPFRIVGTLSQYVPSSSINGADDSSAYNRVIVRINFNDRTSTTGIV